MRPNLPALIERSVAAFDLSLEGRTVLTEAATGNYVVTAVLAARAGATVFALTRDSRFGTVADVRRETEALGQAVASHLSIEVVTSLGEVPLARVDVLTNTGFLRPIDAALVARLPPTCVIPLMWEVWEYRPQDLDLDACARGGICVYGTNESDPRLRTMDYLAFVVMEHLLTHKRTPFSSSVLIVGTPAFGAPVERLLRLAGYRCECRAAGDRVSVEEWDVVVLVEHRNPVELVGSDQAVMPASAFRPHQLVIHVSGHVDFADLPCAHVPANPAPFGYMSYTADFADPKAVVDLHAAGLRVAQGLLAANERGLTGEARKTFVEASAPAQAFEDSRYW